MCILALRSFTITEPIWCLQIFRDIIELCDVNLGVRAGAFLQGSALENVRAVLMGMTMKRIKRLDTMVTREAPDPGANRTPERVCKCASTNRNFQDSVKYAEKCRLLKFCQNISEKKKSFQYRLLNKLPDGYLRNNGANLGMMVSRSSSVILEVLFTRTWIPVKWIPESPSVPLAVGNSELQKSSGPLAIPLLFYLFSTC